MLLFGDSLAFHGPTQPELLTHPGLYPNVAARVLDARVDVVARLGFTARDAWWALTKDPALYSLSLPASDAVVLAVGSSDQLPAAVPSYLRDGLAYLRPGWLRRPVRRGYHRLHPHLVRAWGGRLRVLPQAATDRYLTRCVTAIRQVRPGLPVVGIVPTPFAAPFHGGIDRPHPAAVAAARQWGGRHRVPLLDLDAIVGPHLAANSLNPDGLHWSWAVHAEVGESLAALLSP